MEGNYNISKDGTVFEIREDGSISRIGTVDELRRGRPKGGAGVYRALFFILLCVLAFVLCLFYMQGMGYEEESDRLQGEVFKYKNQAESFKRERDAERVALNGFRARVGDKIPMIIDDVEIANTSYGGEIETNYGKTIRSWNTMYLKPRIKCTGLVPGTKTLKVKWYKPDGSLSQGNSSPWGFSHSSSVNIYVGEQTCYLSAWGNSTRGYWRAGTYRIEIWYGDVCLKAKTFTIY